MMEHPRERMAVRLSGLSLRLPDGRYLLRESSLDVPQGALVILVGMSGSGKSSFVRCLAGLEGTDDSGVRCEGTIQIGETVEDRRTSESRVGVVFQHLALLEELSAADNIRFALEHQGVSREESAVRTRELLGRLHIPASTPLSRMSGGERQRVAIARALSTNPQLLLLDEPTSGLDPVRAELVADLIAETQTRWGGTVIVVTHDHRAFDRHHPRMVLLDHVTASLRRVDAQELSQFFERQVFETNRSEELVVAPRSWGQAARDLIETPGSVLLVILSAGGAVLRGWSHPLWRMRFLWHYLRLVFVGLTMVYVTLAGMMLGFVFTSFSFAQLPFADVTVPLLTEEFLAATGYSTFRVVVPLMISVLLAAQCGAALSADVGARRLTHQFDALRSLGTRPESYLYGNLLLALLLGTPILTLVAFVANWYAALVAFLRSNPEATPTLFRRSFLSTVWPDSGGLPVGCGWVLLKTLTSGLVIGGLSYALGSLPKRSPADVSRHVSWTIFWASLGVLGLHSAFSFIEF